MGFEDELLEGFDELFSTEWETTDGRVVPEPGSITFGNDATIIDGTVFYADLVDSTWMVENHPAEMCAEIFKAFTDAVCRVIRRHGGTVTSFDGDRVMGVFMGSGKNSSAAICALNVGWAMRHLNAKLKEYWNTGYEVGHCIGIDTSELFVVKTGMRGSYDLVWVGSAANFAAKLCAVRGAGRILITHNVFKRLNKKALYAVKDGYQKSRWKTWHWPEYSRTVYTSSWLKAI